MQVVEDEPRAWEIESPADGIIAVVALLALVLALWATTGVAGGAVGLAVGIGWLFLPTVYVFATGHVGLLAVSSPEISTPAIAVVEGGFLALVFAEVAIDGVSRPGRSLTVRAIAGIPVLGATALPVVLSGNLLLAGTVAAVAAGGLTYGSHRYELVALDRSRRQSDAP